MTFENCPACGSSSTRSIYERVYQGKRWALARCRACALHFTSPAPSDDDLSAFYAGDYHAELRTEGGAEAAFGASTNAMPTHLAGT